jgi:hypothetical protein
MVDDLSASEATCQLKSASSQMIAIGATMAVAV